MVKRIIFLNFGILFIFSALSIAGAEKLSADDFKITQFSLSNPFKSQLPQKEKPKEIQQEELEDDYDPGPSVDAFLDDIEKQLQHMSGSSEEDQMNGAVENPALKSVVTGRIWNSNRPQAIIDGKVFDVGDIHNGMKILRIYKEGVDVSFQGKIFTIKEQLSL